MPKPPAASPAATPPADAKGLGYLASTLAAPVNTAEAALRPLSFSDFAGQAKSVERLQVMVGAARRRGDGAGALGNSHRPDRFNRVRLSPAQEGEVTAAQGDWSGVAQTIRNIGKALVVEGEGGVVDIDR